MRILILEYDTLQSDLLVLALRRNGFEPIICEDPSSIRETISLEKPDVLIFDTRLPDQNGIDLLLKLKEESLLKQMYVVVLSALGFPCIVKQSVEAGADEFLVKPLDMKTLITRLKSQQLEMAKKTVSAP